MPNGIVGIQSLVRSRPQTWAIAIALAQFLVTGSVLALGKYIAPAEHFPKVKLIAFATTVAFPLLMIGALKVWGEMGLGMRRMSWHPAFGMSLATGLVFLIQGVRPPPDQSFLGILLVQFINAFGEELLFRGLVFWILMPLVPWRVIMLSSALFGCMHLMQGLMGASWSHAIMRSIITAMAGAMFAAIRLATRSLWAAILLHMFLNMCMIYSNIEVTWGGDWLYVIQRFANVLEMLVVFYVLTRVGRAQSGQLV